jgi:hypothetical protein
MPRSPIEIMVDRACGIGVEPPHEFSAAEVAERVIGHIDTMYPEMWRGVTKNARRSLRGCVINEVNAELKRSGRR